MSASLAYRVRIFYLVVACLVVSLITIGKLRIGQAHDEKPVGVQSETAARETDVAAQAVPVEISPGLRVPIDGVRVDSFKGGFEERRDGHPHEAVDILAPRGTPVHAVTNGTIAKLFYSKPGGNTVYEFDPAGRYCYYYAHLDRYADGVHEGQTVSQGQVIAYVGTTGNASPNTPHLHFAIFELDAERRWWKGRAIDPYLIFKEKG